MYKKLSIALCFAISFAITMQPVSLATGYPDSYVTNDILWYKANDSTTCSGSSPNGVSGSDNQEKIWGYLRNVGLSAEQTAGVMANIQAESGFSPTRHEVGQGWESGGWGLAQWTFGRRTLIANKIPSDLKKYYSQEYGGAPNEKGMIDSIPVEDNDKLLIFELEYLVQEGTERPVTASGFGTASNSWELLKTLKTVEEATVFWHDDFEKSAMTKEQVKNIRGAAAQKIYERFNGTGGSGGGCSSSSGGDFIDYVKRYAWPERTVRLDKKPEYAEAIEKAKSENRYIGDSCLGGGVDCGAFVTTILNDSGFDKNYNYGGENGKAGPTSVQRAWAEALCRSEERRVGKECRSRWSPYH